MLGDVTAINSAIATAMGDVTSLATGNIGTVAGVAVAFAGVALVVRWIRKLAK